MLPRFDCAGNEKRDASVRSSAADRFLSKHGRHGRFPPHPRSRKNQRNTAAAAIGMPLGRGGRKQFSHYRCSEEEKAAERRTYVVAIEVLRLRRRSAASAQDDRCECLRPKSRPACAQDDTCKEGLAQFAREAKSESLAKSSRKLWSSQSEIPQRQKPHDFAGT